MIKLGIFGAGRIGAIHAVNAAAHSQVQVSYIADVYEPAAQQLAHKVGAQVASVEQILADTSVTAVIIASSTDTHADLIERSARAGKAIFCEKPVDLNIERVVSSMRAVETANVVCSIGFNRRYDPQFAGVKQHIESGAIGKLELLSITSRDPGPPPVDYIKVSGGLFKDMMIHDLDMARWLLGEEPVEVFASASCHVDPAIAEAGDVDTALVILKTASGRLCQINNSRRAAYGYDQRVEALGELGMTQAANVGENQVSLSNAQGITSAKPMHFFLERYQQAYRLELDNFVACMVDGAAPVANINDGLQAIVLAEAAAQSLKTQQAVAVAEIYP